MLLPPLEVLSVRPKTATSDTPTSSKARKNRGRGRKEQLPGTMTKRKSRAVLPVVSTNDDASCDHTTNHLDLNAAAAALLTGEQTAHQHHMSRLPPTSKSAGNVTSRSTTCNSQTANATLIASIFRELDDQINNNNNNKAAYASASSSSIPSAHAATHSPITTSPTAHPALHELYRRLSTAKTHTQAMNIYATIMWDWANAALLPSSQHTKSSKRHIISSRGKHIKAALRNTLGYSLYKNQWTVSAKTAGVAAASAAVSVPANLTQGSARTVVVPVSSERKTGDGTNVDGDELNDHDDDDAEERSERAEERTSTRLRSNSNSSSSSESSSVNSDDEYDAYMNPYTYDRECVNLKEEMEMETISGKKRRRAV